MSEPTRKGLVPGLRFSEFLDSAEWCELKIKDIASAMTDYVANGSFQSLRENVVVEDSKDFALYVRLVDLRAGLGHPRQKYVDEKSYKFLKKSALFGQELLMANIGANVGEVWQMPDVDMPATLAPNMIMTKFKSNANSRFIYYFLDSESGQKRISSAVSGSGHPKINKTDLKQIKVLLPLMPKEQQKIADCLSSIDELVTAQTQKVEALKVHKKGLMQQLFPTEGETVPKRRFPEFQDAGEWERDKLANLIFTVTPPQKLLTALYQAEGQFPIIDQSQSYICGWTNDQDALINDDLPLIIFGDHTCALKIVDVPFAQGADGIKILKNKKQTETNYLYQYLLFNPVVMEEYKRHFSILKEKLVFFPKKESGEQQKIADCLTSIDDLIAAQTQKLEALKAHKKGMMQKLFPSMDETTE